MFYAMKTSTSNPTTTGATSKNICVNHRLISTLQHPLTNVKDKEHPHDRQGQMCQLSGA